MRRALVALLFGVPFLAPARPGPVAAQEYAALKLAPAAATVRYGDGRPTESLRVLSGGAEVWLQLPDLSALLGAVYHWRPDVQKLVLKVGGHSLQMAVGSELVLLDGQEAVHLPGEVLLREGQVYVPLAVLLGRDGRSYAWLPAPVAWDPVSRRLTVGTPRGGLTAVRLEPPGDDARLQLLLDRPVDFRVEVATRGRTIVRLPDADLDSDSLALPTGDERFRAIAADQAGGGAGISFSVPETILGYSVQRLDRPPRIEVALTDDEAAVRDRRFTPYPESGLGDTLALTTIVLDPGGGDDDEARSPAGQSEGELALLLARALARQLEDSLHVRVVLTRDYAGNVSDNDRVEAANLAGADLFISLHYDRGAGAASAPRAFVAPPPARSGAGVARPLAELGFEAWGQSRRDSHARSLRLAGLLVEALAREMGRAGAGVEECPAPLLQAAMMPAVYLVVDDIGASGVDQRLNDPDRLHGVVRALAAALDRYRREAS